MVLVPLGKNDYCGIGLVEMMWKLVAAILNRLLKASIFFNNFLYRFRAGRGTGTTTLKAKLLQKLEALSEEGLYVILLDLHKAYDDLDRSKYLEILECYGVGPRARTLLQIYWRRLKMVTRAVGYYGTAFRGECGVTQGHPLSPILFYVVVDAVVQQWVAVMVEGAEE